MAKAIRLAREMALLPYSVRQVTQRKGGRRDRGDRGELREEMPPASAASSRTSSGYADVEVELEVEQVNGAAAVDDVDVDVVEVETGGAERMKVVLREDVETLGKKGDLLEVADGYARNYLVPRGLAMKATKGVVAQAESMRRKP